MKPSHAVPPKFAHAKRLFFCFCNSCLIEPLAIALRPIWIIGLGCNDAPLAWHCPVLSFSPYVLHGTTWLHHLTLNVRMHKPHTPQQRLANYLIHLMSTDSPVSRMLPYRVPCCTTTPDLPGALLPELTNAPTTCRSPLYVTMLSHSARRRQYFRLVLLESHHYKHLTLWGPAYYARPQPLPPSLLPDASLALIATRYFTF